MEKTDAQIAAEQKFLVTTLLVVILLMISIISVTLNWKNWFGEEAPTTSQNEIQETGEIAGNRNDQSWQIIW